MDGGKDWLLGVLKRKAYEESPIQVLEVDDGGSGPGKGENYLSKIHKLRARVLLGSGRIRSISFLVKCEHETEHMKKMSVNGGVFVREIMMYRDVLPKMQELLENINDPDGIFWAKCYDIRLYNRLIFEDLGVGKTVKCLNVTGETILYMNNHLSNNLSPEDITFHSVAVLKNVPRDKDKSVEEMELQILGDSGFKTANRLKMVSLNGALMALKNFAKFHALSKVLLERGEIPTSIFGRNPWASNDDDPDGANKMVTNNVKKLCQKMEEWGDEWKDAIERLKKVDLGNRFLDSFGSKPDEFNVLAHCDSWTNNMMFSGEDIENPTGFRLIDLQMCYVNSPAKDISQFILTSVRIEDREKHMDLLMQTYLNTLTSYLTKLGYEGTIPNMDALQKAMDRKGVATLCDAIGFVPIILGYAEHAPDFEQAMKEHNEAKEKGIEDTQDSFKVHENLTPIAVSVIKYQLKEAMRTGLI